MEKVKVEEEEEKVMSLPPALEALETSPDPLVDVVIQLEQQQAASNEESAFESSKAASQHLDTSYQNV